jgi:hypothetical protein
MLFWMAAEVSLDNQTEAKATFFDPWTTHARLTK